MNIINWNIIKEQVYLQGTFVYRKFLSEYLFYHVDWTILSSPLRPALVHRPCSSGCYPQGSDTGPGFQAHGPGASLTTEGHVCPLHSPWPGGTGPHSHPVTGPAAPTQQPIKNQQRSNKSTLIYSNHSESLTNC